MKNSTANNQAGLPSWGNYPPSTADIRPATEASGSLSASDSQYCLPYSRGRSYGDVCLNNGHTQCPTKFLDMLLNFDSENGLLRAEAGCSLGEILSVIVPRGRFWPVIPGTQYITLGGAIANDVHGKNHHTGGCFGRHITEVKLRRSSGELIVCGPEQNPEWFSATVAGLGMTGLISEATIRLKRIHSDRLSVKYTPFANLDEFFSIDRELSLTSEYTVAWVDSLTKSTRGVYISGDHAADLNLLRNRVGLSFIFGLELMSNWAEVSHPEQRVMLIGNLSWGLTFYTAAMACWLNWDSVRKLVDSSTTSAHSQSCPKMRAKSPEAP